MNKQEETKEEPSKQELIKKIKDEIPFVDIKPYSHNIINLTLNLLCTEYGQEEVNNLIRETDLKDLGWGWVIKY